MYNTLDYQLSNNILTLRLNRPDQLNAFTVEMSDELTHAFNRASDDDSVRAIVVTGAGRAFCAGMDLASDGNVFGLDESKTPTLDDMANPDNMTGVRDTGGKVTLSIFNCKKPVIAAINGPAVGIGATMILAMDIRLASEQARFGFVFSKIGITLEACSSWFLPRVVGISQALEWTYTGEVFDAQEAHRAGLIKGIYSPEALLEEAYVIARKIADNTSPVSIALTRQMLYRNSAADHPLQAHKVESLAVFYASTKDGKEGVKAFLEKRKPRFNQQASSHMPLFYPWWNDQ
jgi:enoyl-CoA hydratase/carnithine racemase